MLSDFTGAEKVYLACGYTDIRKGIDGLAAMVQQEFELNPFTNTLFLFCGRRRDRIKGLYWEGDGFILLYKGNRGGTCESTHYVRVDFLEQVVIEEIRRLTKFATKYENQFAEAVMQFSAQAAEADRQALQKKLYALEARDRELDQLFERIYEDNVSGKLTDERFARMFERYDTQQKELAEQIKATRKALEKASTKTLTKEAFLSTVRKYTRAKKLTSEMVNELIDHIEVHQAEKVDGVWEQRVTIYYNVIGPIIIPEGLPLPVPDVIVNTRRGVNVTYAGAQKSE